MLPDTLAAFEQQTQQPDEIIVVGNDLSEINIPNNDIKAFAAPTRKSPSFNRNKGAEIATGDVIIYHDVDDLPHRQKVEFVQKAFLEHDVDAFVHGFEYNKLYPFMYTDLDMKRVEKLKEGKYLYSDICVDGDLHHGHLSIKRDIVNQLKYKEHIFFGEDSEFARRVLLKGYSVYYGNHKLINYQPSYQTNRKWYNV